MTSESTNLRTVLNRSHCSWVNWSRTEKKSVPRASPRWARAISFIVSLLLRVAAGGGLERRVPLAARRGGGRTQRAAAGVRPLRPVVPPAARVGGGAGQPLVGAGTGDRAGAVPGLGVAGRVHQVLDVPAAGQDERVLPAEQPGRLVGSGPGHQVVGLGADHVARDLDLGQVDRGAKQGD